MVAVVFGIIIVLVIVIYFLTRDSGTSLSSMQSASVSSNIPAGSLPANSTQNFTYSMWFFIREWTETDNEKVILERDGTDDDGSIVCPKIYLGETNNDINVQISCKGAQDHVCRVSNVPIQKWVNLIISVYGRSLDVYIDGKLVRTCVLPGVPQASGVNGSDIKITPNGGFSGETSQFVYWDGPTNPTEAAAIYRKGYGGSMIGNLLNKYRFQFTFIKDGRDVSSFQI
jgi:hypothetical protein